MSKQLEFEIRVPEDGPAVIHSHYHRDFVEQLKRAVPHYHRGWDGDAWTVDPRYVEAVVDLAKSHYHHVTIIRQQGLETQYEDAFSGRTWSQSALFGEE